MDELELLKDQVKTLSERLEVLEKANVASNCITIPYWFENEDAKLPERKKPHNFKGRL